MLFDRKWYLGWRNYLSLFFEFPRIVPTPSPSTLRIHCFTNASIPSTSGMQHKFWFLDPHWLGASCLRAMLVQALYDFGMTTWGVRTPLSPHRLQRPLLVLTSYLRPRYHLLWLVSNAANFLPFFWNKLGLFNLYAHHRVCSLDLACLWFLCWSLRRV